MTAHHPDWREWLESLNAAGAEYVVVGGVALAFHGIVRYTVDLEVLVHATPGNARRVIQALHAFGLGSLDVTEGDLATPGKVIQLGFPPGRIDLLTAIDGVSWDEVDRHAVAGTYGGTATRFIARADLIRNKRASGRPRDLADVAELGGGADSP
jgi:hypothetical protein